MSRTDFPFKELSTVHRTKIWPLP